MELFGSLHVFIYAALQQLVTDCKISLYLEELTDDSVPAKMSPPLTLLLIYGKLL